MRILPFVMLLLFVNTATSQIITEYSASNLNTYEDNFGKYEDWIEIYNNTGSDIDLGGYGLSDKSAKPQKWLFPSPTLVASGEYLIVWCSGRDTINRGEWHTNFKLSQTKDNEVITFSDPAGTLLEEIPLELTLLGHSRAKDDLGNWVVSEEPSFGTNTTNTEGDLFTGYTMAPVIEQEAGFYTDSLLISIEGFSNLQVRFTLNGTLPTLRSEIYVGPFWVNETTVVKARHFSDDDNVAPGKIDYKTFLIDEDFTLPVFSIAADSLQLLANGQGEIRPIGSIEYFVDNELSSSSYGELNRHGQDSWVNPQRSLDWVSRDEMGYSRTLDEKLFSYSDRTDYQRFMLRASGDDNYPAIDDYDHEGSAHIRDEYVHTLAQEGI